MGSLFVSSTCVAYLYPKDYKKGAKNLFLNFGCLHDVPMPENEPVNRKNLDFLSEFYEIL